MLSKEKVTAHRHGKRKLRMHRSMQGMPVRGNSKKRKSVSLPHRSKEKTQGGNYYGIQNFITAVDHGIRKKVSRRKRLRDR